MKTSMKTIDRDLMGDYGELSKIKNLFIATLAGTVFITTFSFIYSDKVPEVKPKQSIDFHQKIKVVHVKPSESYWATLINIESRGGKLRYRPSNKSKTCKYTSGACGVHQLTEIALKDIGICKGRISKCKKDRDNYQKSQKMANAYDKKITEYGCTSIGWERYIAWNQSCLTSKRIFKASKGKQKLSKKILRNMANNSKYSYKQLENMGSKKAAKKFLSYRKQKWFHYLVKI